MAATKYTRNYDFESFQTSNPSTPLPADQLESELDELKTVTDGIIDNLALVQRDDNELANATVGNDQLKSSLSIGINTATTWLTATAYAVDDAVWNSNALYHCQEAHTSGTFSTDLAAGKWVVVFDASAIVTAAQTAQTAAETAQTAAETAQTAAETAETNAATSETNAATSETNAAASATAAAAAQTAAEAAQAAAEAASPIGKHAIPIPASAMVARTTNGAASGLSESTTNKIMVKSFDFDGATNEYVQFTMPMPKSWDEGTVSFEPVWSAASGPGTVIWGLQAVALSNDDALDTAFGTTQTSTDTLLLADDVHVGPESAAITIGGTPAEGDFVVFQIYRDAATDTHAADAKLLGIRLYITTDAGTDA